MNTDLNSTISGGSNQNIEAGSLQEIIGGEEYGLLMEQAKNLFASTIGGSNFKDIAIKKMQIPKRKICQPYIRKMNRGLRYSFGRYSKKRRRLWSVSADESIGAYRLRASQLRRQGA